MHGQHLHVDPAGASDAVVERAVVAVLAELGAEVIGTIIVTARDQPRDRARATWPHDRGHALDAYGCPTVAATRSGPLATAWRHGGGEVGAIVRGAIAGLDEGARGALARTLVARGWQVTPRALDRRVTVDPWFIADEPARRDDGGAWAHARTVGLDAYLDAWEPIRARAQAPLFVWDR